MPARSVALALMLLALPFAPGPAAAQSTLIGIVRDDSTSAPISGVSVRIDGTSHQTESNAQGRFSLSSLPAGMYAVTFRRIGYLPTRLDVRLEAGDTTRANPTMIPSSVALDSILVTGRPEAVRGVGIGREAFDERRRRGFGRFIDTDEIRRNEGHLHLDDLLRRLGAVEMRQIRIDGFPGWAAFNRTRKDAAGRFNCIMEVYYNGVKVSSGGIVGALTGPLTDLRSYALPGLDAVEVYRSAAETPPEYGGSRAACGVILLWSRVAP